MPPPKVKLTPCRRGHPRRGKNLAWTFEKRIGKWRPVCRECKNAIWMLNYRDRMIDSPAYRERRLANVAKCAARRKLKLKKLRRINRWRKKLNIKKRVRVNLPVSPYLE